MKEATAVHTKVLERLDQINKDIKTAESQLSLVTRDYWVDIGGTKMGWVLHPNTGKFRLVLQVGQITRPLADARIEQRLYFHGYLESFIVHTLTSFVEESAKGPNA